MAAWGLTCAPTSIDTNPSDPSNNFDLERRLAQITANGGIYAMVNPGEALFLRINSSVSPIYGAAISIPASATVSLPRALLSLEPYNGVALSTSGTEVLVGHAIATALVDAELGTSLSLPAAVAEVRAPFSLQGFALPLSIDGVYLGRSISEFATGLTSVPARSFANDPSTVAGLVAKFGLFVAYHTGQFANDVIDPEHPSEPPDPSTQRYFVSFGSCTKNGIANSGLATSLTYEIIGSSLSQLTFTAHNGVTEIIRYQVQTTQAVLAPPAHVAIDPGFPSGIAAFAFAIRCNGSSVLEVTATHNLVTDVSQLAVAGVEARHVQVSAWYQSPNAISQQVDCGLPPHGCRRILGKAHFRMGVPLAENPGLVIDNGLQEGRAGIDTYLLTTWDVPL